MHNKPKKRSKVKPFLCKAVLNKSLISKMECQDVIAMVNMLAQRYAVLFIDYDQQVMARFVALLNDMHGSPFPQMELTGSDLSFTRRLIRGQMPVLISSVERELPQFAEELGAVDWKLLFGIVDIPLRVVVTAPSDESSESSPDSAAVSMDSAKIVLSDVE
ncbi:uncharacterized protein LOC119075358 [Bradysia coprophila]|uniref:uncharacterized protein LOC119075358 n=1 Tax=Bradysia coprophila TaxID=38358 RepID=UPI00187D8074|nr:uncharacterized protein LOC119075358 [Bradysia coprophila]